MIATFLRAGQGYRLPDAIQERRSRINSKMMVLAIDTQRDWDGSLDIRRVRTRIGLCGSAMVDGRTSSNDCRRSGTSNGQQKFPAGRIRRARWFVVIHTVSLSRI